MRAYVTRPVPLRSVLALPKYVAAYSDNVRSWSAAQTNAGRHFAFIVMSARYVSTAAARAIGAAHEVNARHRKDSNSRLK